MGFTQANRGVEKKGIVGLARVVNNRQGNGVGQFVIGTNNIAVKGVVGGKTGGSAGLRLNFFRAK